MFSPYIEQFKTIYLPEIDSTNKFAKEKLKENVTPFLVISNFQSEGYGRHNREFNSPKNTGIYFSYAWPGFALEDTDLLTIRAGVALAKVFENKVDQKFQLKWVNDLLLNGIKVAGILVEITKDGVVLGIGIDLSKSENIDGFIFNHQLSENEKEQLLSKITQELSTLKDDQLISAYKKYSNILGQKIELQIEGEIKTGVVSDFSATGELILDSGESFSSGEVVKVFYEK